MLIEYSVENFRSIAEKTIFSMIPAKGVSKPYNLIKVENNPKIKKLLRSSVIYGANASGKTNLLIALSIMRHIVLTSKNKNKGDSFDEYYPFVLDNIHDQKPTKFSINFIHKDIEYYYEFSYNSDQIVSENLIYYQGKKQTIIFKRELDNLEPYVDHQELLDLFKHTGENVLFLSKANNEYKKFGPIYEWFNKHLYTIGPLSRISPRRTINYMNESIEKKQKVIDLMHFADFDISNVMGQNKEINDPNLLEGKKIITAIHKTNDKNESESDIRYEISEIKSIRKKIDGSEIIQDFMEFESGGTKQFFNIAGLWAESLQEIRRILIIDEFDIHLHPDLQQYLIKIFHDPDINKTDSQIIFSTHNTRLLSTNLFRREQIWFTEKNPKTKSTEIFSLYDYEKRQDKSIEKGYFLGRYGGLPDIKYHRVS